MPRDVRLIFIIGNSYCLSHIRFHYQTSACVLTSDAFCIVCSYRCTETFVKPTINLFEAKLGNNVPNLFYCKHINKHNNRNTIQSTKCWHNADQQWPSAVHKSFRFIPMYVLQIYSTSPLIIIWKLPLLYIYNTAPNLIVIILVKAT